MGGLTISISGGNRVIGAWFVATFAVLATDTVAFESQIWPGSLPSASATIGVQSSELVAGSPYTVEGWVLINYVMSVDCSPPRACYANSQWVYAHAHCAMGAIREVKRVSLDLNGNVLAETGERAAYIPTRGSLDRAVVRSLCEPYGFNIRNPWRGRDGDADD
jgi:hypothetical protein